MNVLTTRAIRNHSGFALIAFLLVLVSGASFVLLKGLNAAATQSYRDDQTTRALAEVKAALIGYALTYSEQHTGQPQGFLPCPDTDGNGMPNPPCGTSSQSFIGRLPWQILGLPPLRDGTGECLWYAVSGTYKNNPKISLTSDTNGQFIVQDGNANVIVGAAPETQAIAIIFAAGAVLGVQDRSASAPNECGSTNLGDPVNQPANYLDSRDGINNATGNPALPTATPSAFVSPPGILADFNDKMLAITPQDFNLVYARMNRWVADRAQQCLAAFGSTHSWAAALDQPATNPPDLTADSNQRFGRIPNAPSLDPPPPGWNSDPDGNVGGTCFTDVGGFTGPGWWWWDTWREMVFYAVDAASSPGGGSSALQLTGTTPPDSQFIIAVAGRKLSGQQRSNAAQKADIANYLEDHNEPNFAATVPPGSAGNIPTGDEQFATTPTVAGTPFNDVVCNNAGCP